MKRLKWIAAGLALLVLAGAGGAWWYLHRDTGPVELVAAAGVKGTSTYEFLDDLAAVVDRHSDGVLLTVRETKGIDENAVLAQLGPRGEVVDTSRARHTAPEGIVILPSAPTRGTHLSVIQSDTVISGEMRLVAPLFLSHFQLIVTEASGIRSIQELGGRKVALPDVNTAGFKAFWAIAEHYQVAIEDVAWTSMPLREATDALTRGRADGVFISQSIRSPDVVAMLDELRRRRVGVRFLPVDQAPAMALRRPFLEASTLERGAYLGYPPLPAEDTATGAVRFLLVAHRDADADAVETVTRVLMEQRFDLMVRNPLAQEVRAPDLASLPVPLHEGALRYYTRNQPGFLESNANTIGILLTVGGVLASIGAWVRGQLTAGRKNRADRFALDVAAIAGRAQAATSVAELVACRDDLDAMIAMVVRALDSDEVTEEGFQSFTFAWEAVRRMVGDRLAEMRMPSSGPSAPAHA
jgi:TRAP-type uncharacterized transport system substrate-binding protein